MEECLQKLDLYIRSCHLKDVHLLRSFALAEEPAGMGDLNIAARLKQIDALDPEMLVMIEHLSDNEVYGRTGMGTAAVQGQWNRTEISLRVADTFLYMIMGISIA